MVRRSTASASCRRACGSLVVGTDHGDELAPMLSDRVRWPSSALEALGGRAHEAVEQDRPSPCGPSACSGHPASCPPSAYALLRRKCLCELLDRTAPKHIDLRDQPGELVLTLRLFGIGHAPYMATDGACCNPVIVSIFRAETLPPISTHRREGARCKVAAAN
jgi:hypothetical protein